MDVTLLAAIEHVYYLLIFVCYIWGHLVVNRSIARSQRWFSPSPLSSMGQSMLDDRHSGNFLENNLKYS